MHDHQQPQKPQQTTKQDGAAEEKALTATDEMERQAIEEQRQAQTEPAEKPTE